MLVHACNHTTPNVKCEAETEESLEGQQAGRPCPNMVEARDSHANFFFDLHQ